MYQQQGYLRRLTTDKFTLIAGVILPVIAITVEASTHICAAIFFDPIPTAWHLILVLLVPLAQLQVWFTIRRGAPDRLTLAGIANAIVIGISIFYSIVYLPLVPMAALTVLAVVGLLPLTPFLSLIAALIMRQQLGKIAAAAPQKTFALRAAGLFLVLGLTFTVIGLVELPALLTSYGLKMAVSSSAQTRADGIRFLRTYGSKDRLLRSCYNPNRRAPDLLGGVLSIRNHISIEEARKVYYRVTGETFDMSLPPQRVAGHWVPQETFDFENDQGGTRIGGKLKGLSLSTSKLEGLIDADGGVGYLQWALAFKNDSEWPRQARAEIQLPPGAVVSSVALGKNYEERGAVFGGRRLKEGYDLYQQRNPVVVTTAGRDRILVQLYPVPEFGNEMKVHLGITVPLVLQSRSRARLLLPHFEGRNFRIPDYMNHTIWFQATRPIGTEYGGLYYGQMPDNSFMLVGQISDQDLSRPERSLLFARLDRDTAWSHNPFEVEGTIVKQSIEERTPPHLRRIVLVVDTSASMADWEPDINAALGAVPSGIDLKIVLADGEWLHETKRKDVVASGLQGVSTLLASTTFKGGADNAPALRKAWDLAAEAPGTNAIIWIHGPQLVPLESVEELRSRWQSRPYGPLLYSVQTSKGSDAIAKKLDGINEVKSVVRVGTLREDLEQLFGQLSGRVKTFEFVRSIEHSKSPPEESEGYKTSDHLAKLWARDEVVRILNARDESLNNAATSLALRYQLVTPISNAAVMGDIAEIYPNSELAPIDTNYITVAGAEVETLFLVAVLFVIGLFCMNRQALGG